MTDTIRKIAWGLFTLGVLTALVAWVWKDRSPNDVIGLLTVLLGAAGVAEGSAVGKRATVKPELMK